MAAEPAHAALPGRVGPRLDGVAAHEATQVVGEGGDGAIAIGRRARRGLRDDRPELAGDRLAEGMDERRAGPGAGLRQHLRQRLAGDRPLQRDQLEQDEPERALIALGVELVVAPRRLFGRHVERRSDDGAVGGLAVAGLEADRRARRRSGARRRVARRAGAGCRRGRRRIGGVRHEAADAPVHDVDLVVPADHQVGGLEVAVDDAALVGVADGVTHLEKVLDARRQGMVLVRRLLLLVKGARVGDQLAEGLPLDQLHRVGGPAARRDFEAVDRDDVRVVELGRHLDLAHEARAGGAIVGDLERQLLERDPAEQLDVAGDMDRAHAAAAGDRLEHVAGVGRWNRGAGAAVRTGGGAAGRHGRRLAGRRGRARGPAASELGVEQGGRLGRVEDGGRPVVVLEGGDAVVDEDGGVGTGQHRAEEGRPFGGGASRYGARSCTRRRVQPGRRPGRAVQHRRRQDRVVFGRGTAHRSGLRAPEG